MYQVSVAQISYLLLLFSKGVTYISLQPSRRLALMFRPHIDDSDDRDYHLNTSKSSHSSTDQYLYAKLDRLSVALIDSNRVNVGELLSFTSRCADLRLSVTKAKTRVSFALGNVQIDQQRMSQETKAPVVLAPTPVKHPQPLLQFLVWKDNSKEDTDSFEYVALEVRILFTPSYPFLFFSVSTHICYVLGPRS